MDRERTLKIAHEEMLKHTFNTFVDDTARGGPFNVSIHGITKEMVKDSPVVLPANLDSQGLVF
jgi:hypothetical protein